MHDLPLEEVFSRLHSTFSGLAGTEASRRLAESGPNTLKEEKRTPPYTLFLRQFADFMILLLMAAALIAGLTGDLTDTLVILAIVVLNGVLGFTQEYRAERALTALRRLVIPRVHVLRDGLEQEILSSSLVPGDVVRLSAGSRVPADGRIVASINLQIDESPLTGESAPIGKTTGPLPPETPLPDRGNMALMGTTVTYGRGDMLVTATGMNTELGRIAHLLQAFEKGKTPLQKRLTQMGKWLASAALMICGIIFLAGIWRGEPFTSMLLTAVSLAVAAIPEGLPAVVAIVLAVGAQRMTAHQALIRKLPAVETLGCVTAICSDKTGTLTENRMAATHLYLPSRQRSDRWIEVLPSDSGSAKTLSESGKPLVPSKEFHLQRLLEAVTLCNDARLHFPLGDADPQAPSRENFIGDPMEGALLLLASHAGLEKDKTESLHPRLNEIPFDASRKRMTTLHRVEQKFRLFVKGGIEEVLRLSSRFQDDAMIAALDAETRERILTANVRMAGEGLRVLAAAYRDLDGPPRDLENEERDLVFLGLIGLMDTARPEARSAVATCREAGILPIMITGDHPLTAGTIARKVGILREGQNVFQGSDLEKISQERLNQEVERITVYARALPEHKVRIVEALQHRGHIVAMTGDGVNDAPALKRAHIGVAMGITGTDVSKEAADLILLNDNFATIVAAVREGRRIYDNIRKFTRYMLSTNTGELLVMFFAILLGMPLPLLPIQILWINLVTDGLPALALGAEPVERGIMKRPPRHPAESLFARGLGWHILWVGALMAGGTLGIYAWALEHYPLEQSRSLIFYTLVMFQLFHVLAIRSERDPLWTQGMGSNPFLLGAVLLGVLLQVGILEGPWFQTLFHTTSIALGDYLICTFVASSVFFAVEIEKGLIRKGLLWKDTQAFFTAR